MPITHTYSKMNLLWLWPEKNNNLRYQYLLCLGFGASLTTHIKTVKK